MVSSNHLQKHNPPCVWVCAAGTGGHIFPGLAVAEILRANGHPIYWIGTPQGMEQRLVEERQFPLLTIDFSGLRGKGVGSWLSLPWRLMKAIVQMRRYLHDHPPALILAMGGYIIVPTILANRLFSHAKVVIHEQNRLAGTANRKMSRFADKVLCGFSGALPQSQAVGNPIHPHFFNQLAPADRYSQRALKQMPLRIVIMGGSLGAKAINQLMPKALALWAAKNTDTLSILHQCGRGQEAVTRSLYEATNLGKQVEWVVEPFINDVATVLAACDLVIARAGAQTVSEIAAIGVAALFIPFPFAIDDHQTHNARYLSDSGAALLMPQSSLTPEKMATFLMGLDRTSLMSMAEKSHGFAMRSAAEKVAQIINDCIESAEKPLS